jgi:hypothetical protein
MDEEALRKTTIELEVLMKTKWVNNFSIATKVRKFFMV